MSSVAAVRAQAKLNLWLGVLAREESGYHSIETLFHRLDLADDITVTLAPPGERSMKCSVDVGPPEENLAYRAAELYCSATKWETGFHIDIVKRIPLGGGLGGGSADAGATLRALAALHQDRYHDRLLMLAGKLGADIPFLTTEAVAALGWGHGECMFALAPLPKRHVALLVPPFAVATVDAYKWLDEMHSETTTTGMPRLLHSSDMSGWPGITAVAANSFLIPVARHTADGVILRAVLALREAGAILAQMTGSGSTLFGIFEQTADAEALARDTGCRVILTHTATAVEAVRRSD